MKYIKTAATWMIFGIITSSGFAQQTTHQHTKHLDRLINGYLAIHEALADDNLETAKSHLDEFRKEVIGNPEKTHHEEHRQMHAEHHGAMAEAVGRADEASSIAAFRSAFRDITENLAKAVRNQEYTGRNLFLQFCPMALNGEGAEWISDTRQVANPYLGREMPTCGVENEMLSKES